jgi:hypothetical protein
MSEIHKEFSKILPNIYAEENKRSLKRIYVGKYPPKGTITPINTILLRNCIFYALNCIL